MAWNGSDLSSSSARNARTPRRLPKASAPSRSALRRGLLAGLLVVALGLLALWFSLRPAPVGSRVPRDRAPHSPARIVERPPAPRKSPAKKIAKPRAVDPREDYDHDLCYRDEKGILRYKDSLCRAYDPSRKRTPVVNAAQRETRIFSNRCERAIASLLMFDPNGAMFRSPDYSDPDFQKSFMEAMASPIRIEEDDNAYERELKQAVSDAKTEIARRIREGEELADILNDVKKDIERLSAYKRNLMDEVKSMVKDGGLSTDDVKDLVAAANKMFEKEGLNPIEADDFVTWNLRLSAKRNGEDPEAAVEAYENEQAEKAAEETEERGE